MRVFLKQQLEKEQAGATPGSYVGRLVGTGSDGAHVLIRDLRTSTGQPVTDHLWFPNTKEWAGVAKGSTVTFDASAHSYMKGKNRTLDFGLNRPMGLRTVKSAYRLYFDNLVCL